MRIEVLTNYYFIFFFLMWAISTSASVQRNELLFDYGVRRLKPGFAWFVFLPIICIIIFGPLRFDYYAYARSYRSISSYWGSGIEYILSTEDERGFALFTILIHRLSGGSVFIYRLCICLLQSIPLITILRKYSENFMFSLYVFIATTCHMAWMMNGIRQFLAVTMIFAATPYIVERRYLRAVLVVLLAMSFHRSAVVMIPAIFIAQGKPWNKWTLLFSFAIIVATAVFAGSQESFNVVAEAAGYSLKESYRLGDDGMNPIRAFINAVPMILAYMSRRKIVAENNPIINVCTNMSIITTGVSMIAVVTSGIMVGRMPIYTSLWSLILLPHVIHTAFPGSTGRLVSVAAVVLYFGFYLYSVGAIF